MSAVLSKSINLVSGGYLVCLPRHLRVLFNVLLPLVSTPSMVLSHTILFRKNLSVRGKINNQFLQGEFGIHEHQK